MPEEGAPPHSVLEPLQRYSATVLTIKGKRNAPPQGWFHVSASGMTEGQRVDSVELFVILSVLTVI